MIIQYANKLTATHILYTSSAFHMPSAITIGYAQNTRQPAGTTPACQLLHHCVNASLLLYKDNIIHAQPSMPPCPWQNTITQTISLAADAHIKLLRCNHHRSAAKVLQKYCKRAYKSATKVLQTCYKSATKVYIYTKHPFIIPFIAVPSTSQQIPAWHSKSLFII
jgi:hypothetical protein